VKIALFGGSFDPIHYGHIRPVREVMDRLGIDRTIFLPTAQPPHKLGKEFAPPHRRFAMVELAVLDEDDMRVSEFELTPEKPAYSIDSVEHFRELEPNAELFLILGGDAFADLSSWKRWEELIVEANLIVLVRPGWRLDDYSERLPEPLRNLATDDRVTFFQNEPVSISATELRRRLASGAEVSTGDVPGMVLKYIRKYCLYR
jgi:nicotinate-nucleotide adenylyltransferase